MLGSFSSSLLSLVFSFSLPLPLVVPTMLACPCPTLTSLLTLCLGKSAYILWASARSRHLLARGSESSWWPCSQGMRPQEEVTHLRLSELRGLFITLHCWLILFFHLSLHVSFFLKLIRCMQTFFDFYKKSLFSYLFVLLTFESKYET